MEPHLLSLEIAKSWTSVNHRSRSRAPGSIMSRAEKTRETKPGNLLTFALLGCLLALGSYIILTAAGTYTRSSLKPFRALTTGLTSQQVLDRAGPPEYPAESSDQVGGRSSTPSFACTLLKSSTPPLHSPVFDESDVFYGPFDGTPLPESPGVIWVYFPSLYQVHLYFDQNNQLHETYVCIT